jgi:anti-sigma factor RsiW
MGAMRRLLSKVMRPNPRKCEETRALTSEYVDGELDVESRERVERHGRFCHRCQTVLDNLRQTLGRLRTHQEIEPTGDPYAVAARVARGWHEHA